MNEMKRTSECGVQCFPMWPLQGAVVAGSSWRGLDGRRAWIREKIRDLGSLSIVVFTWSSEAVHMVLGKVQENRILTKQWVFSSQVSWSKVVGILEQAWLDSDRRYMFLPNRATNIGFCEGHLCSNLTREGVLSQFPGVHVIRSACFLRLTRLLEPYDLGRGAYDCLLGLELAKNVEDFGEICADLRMRSQEDVAAIFRLLVRGLIFGSKAFKRTPRCRCDLEVKAC